MTDDTQASAIPPQPQIAPAPAQTLNGIGGWLILPMLGLFASIILQVRELPPEVADARLERLAVAFEAQKPYLMSRWRWPERFRT